MNVHDAIAQADDLLGRTGHTCEGCRRKTARSQLTPTLIGVGSLLLCETCHEVEMRVAEMWDEAYSQGRVA